MSRPIFVLCEGPHDISFLSRVLKVNGIAIPVTDSISNLPKPFGDFFLQRLKNRNAGNARLGGSGPTAPDEPPLLETVLKSTDGSRMWYFLNCCGDSRSQQINSFLHPIVTMAQTADPNFRLAEVGFLFVNDADQIGINVRCQGIINKHAQLLFPLCPGFESHTPNTVVSNGGYGAGTCIFAAADSEFGTLEDIVTALWSPQHAGRRDRSRDLMDSFAEIGTEIGPESTPCKILKATLTTAGQVECPGFSLAVILRETSALDDEKIRTDSQCRSIMNVFMTV